MRKIHKWTQEEIDYLREIAYGKHLSEIVEMMSEKFNMSFSPNQIKGIMGRQSIKTGFTGRFEKGMNAWNKNTKGLVKSNKTTFKKGRVAENKKPIGSERINVYGYTEIKVAEPNIWDLKHRVIYRKHYGEIPEGMNVIFSDGDKSNFNIDNLVLVTRNQLFLLNKNNLIYNDSELTKTSVNVVKVIEKVSELNKKSRV